jgi:hypothetical protein
MATPASKQRTQRGKAATEAAGATAKYGKYAEKERLFFSLRRNSGKPRFKRWDGGGPVQTFAAREQIRLVQGRSAGLRRAERTTSDLQWLSTPQR